MRLETKKAFMKPGTSATPAMTIAANTAFVNDAKSLYQFLAKKTDRKSQSVAKHNEMVNLALTDM